MTDQNWNTIGLETATDDGTYGFAAVDIQFFGSADMTYTATGIHRAYAQLYDYDYQFWPNVSIFYYDFYYFGSFQSQQIFQPWSYAFLGPGPTVTRLSPPIILGSTYDGASVTTVSPEILMINAKVHEVTGTFDEFRNANIILKDSPHWSAICGPTGDPTEQFTLIINFQLPTGGQLVESRCKAFPQSIPYQDYNVGTATCTMDDSVKGHMSVPARRKGGGYADHNPGIRFTIGGNKSGQTGTIDTPGTVRILCNP